MRSTTWLLVSLCLLCVVATSALAQPTFPAAFGTINLVPNAAECNAFLSNQAVSVTGATNLPTPTQLWKVFYAATGAAAGAVCNSEVAGIQVSHTGAASATAASLVFQTSNQKESLSGLFLCVSSDNINWISVASRIDANAACIKSPGQLKLNSFTGCGTISPAPQTITVTGSNLNPAVVRVRTTATCTTDGNGPTSLALTNGVTSGTGVLTFDQSASTTATVFYICTSSTAAVGVSQLAWSGATVTFDTSCVANGIVAAAPIYIQLAGCVNQPQTIRISGSGPAFTPSTLPQFAAFNNQDCNIEEHNISLTPSYDGANFILNANTSLLRNPGSWFVCERGNSGAQNWSFNGLIVATGSACIRTPRPITALSGQCSGSTTTNVEVTGSDIAGATYGLYTAIDCLTAATPGTSMTNGGALPTLANGAPNTIDVGTSGTTRTNGTPLYVCASTAAHPTFFTYTGATIEIRGPCYQSPAVLYLMANYGDHTIGVVNESGFAAGMTLTVNTDDSCSSTSIVSGITATLGFNSNTDVLFTFNTSGINTDLNRLSLCVNTGTAIQKVINGNLALVAPVRPASITVSQGVLNVPITVRGNYFPTSSTPQFIITTDADCITAGALAERERGVPTLLANTDVDPSGVDVSPLAPPTDISIALAVDTRSGCSLANFAAARTASYPLCIRWNVNHSYVKLADVFITAQVNIPNWTFPVHAAVDTAFVASIHGQLSDCASYTFEKLQKLGQPCTGTTPAGVTVSAIGAGLGYQQFDGSSGYYDSFSARVTVSSSGTPIRALQICYKATADAGATPVALWQLDENSKGIISIGSQLQTLIVSSTANAAFTQSNFANGLSGSIPTGTRIWLQTINFADRFAGKPYLMIGVSGFGFSNSDARVYCSAISFDEESLTTRCITYEDSAITSLNINVLAQYTARDLGLTSEGTIRYSSQGRRDWWNQLSNASTTLPTHRLQDQAISIGPYTSPPSIVTGLRHLYIDRTRPAEFEGSISFPAGVRNFRHQVDVRQQTRVARLAYQYMSFPKRTASGYGLLSGEGSLAPGGCNTITFDINDVFAAAPSALVFARGWSVNQATGTTGVSFNLTTANVLATGLDVCLAETGPAVLTTVYYSWAAFGRNT